MPLDLKPYDRVRIVSDRFTTEGAPPGTIGFVIEKHPDGALEVEVSDPHGTTIALFVARQDDLELALPEKEKDIALPLSGWQVERCCVDSAFGVMFIRGRDAFEFRLGGSFKLRHAGTEAAYFPGDKDVTKLAGALSLLHKTARTAVALKDGTLEIRFSDGGLLSVPPDEHYEAWELSGPRGLLIVSLPGGGLAYWSARDETDSANS